jgi:hypothetical protein
MKPDWQNKSFAKGGAATGPSTMHSKLKVGMSTLHSKIGMANSNMPQAPKPVAKPVVRKFADGGMVRGGVMSDEDYAKRMEQGEKNMERLRSAADSIKSFFSPKEKASADNITGDSGMSASDMAKKQAMSGGAQMPAAAEEPRRQISDYMVKKEATEAKTEPVAAPVEAEPVKAKKVVKPTAEPAMEMPQQGRSGRKADVVPARPPRGQTGPMAGKRKLDAGGPSASGKIIEERMAQRKANAGRRADEEFTKLYRSR